MRKTLVSVLVASSMMGGFSCFAQDVAPAQEGRKPITHDQNVAYSETLADAISAAYSKNHQFWRNVNRE